MANQLFTLLKQDHQEVRQLMEDIVYARQEKRHDLFIDLSDLLKTHLQIEEQNFYPKLQGRKELQPAQKDALREHQETRDMLEQLDRLSVQDIEWQQTFRLMQQEVLKHFQVEEGYVFEKCANFMSEQQLDEIAQKCQEQKQAAQQHWTRQPEQEKRI